jgi:PLD-like domain
MARLIAGAELWREIRRASRTSSRLDAAVAFIGRNPEKLLRWPRRVTIVADVTKTSVELGRTSAKGVQKLIRNGANVRSVPSLHAKVYVFDKVAFVGSPNASQQSTRLEEAAIRLTNARELTAARQYVHRLWRQANPLPGDLLRQLSQLEPRRLGGAGGGGGSRASPRAAIAGRRGGLADVLRDRDLWLDAVVRVVVPEQVQQEQERVATKLLDQSEVESTASVEWTSTSKRLYKHIPDQDLLFVWWEPKPKSKRSPYGRLEGPLRCLGGFDLNKRSAGYRYSRAEYGLRKRLLRLDAAGIATLSRLIPRARTGTSKQHAVHLHGRINDGAPIRLRANQRTLFFRLFTRLSRR